MKAQMGGGGEYSIRSQGKISTCTGGVGVGEGGAPWNLTNPFGAQNRGDWEHSVMGIVCREESVQAGQA